MLFDLFFRLRALFHKKAADSQLDDELRFHFEHQLEKYLRAGLPREEALRRVRLDFGGADQIKEECRDARGVQLFETLVQDIRYALRTLRKSPGFTSVALLTLALGIGANTAIFSVVYGVLLRPLPYRDAGHLVVLNETTPRVGVVAVSYLNYQDWRAQNHTFSAMAAATNVGFNLAGIGQPESISGQAVTPNFLRVLGIQPLVGRGFNEAEEKPGTAPVVLLSYQLWQSHFGGDPGAVGRSITLDSRRFTIVGVMPPNFRWIEKTDVLEPIGVWATENSSATSRPERGDMVAIGRLNPGISFDRARTEMEGIAARLARAYPEANDQFGVKLQPVRDVFVSELRPAILVLLAAVIFVLLVACANVANLFLMRGAGRSKEMALRLAIGASRSRIVRQLLTESFVLASLGGLLGIGLAMAGIRGITRLIPAETLSGALIDLNSTVLAFAAAAVLLSMFVFGLAPAIHSAKADVQTALKDGGRSVSAAKEKNHWRGTLVIAEVSLAVVLLVGAGLMMKSLYRLLSVDAGFRPERVLTMQLSLRTAQYEKDPAVLNFWNQVLDRVRSVPGVENLALGTAIPLTDDHWRTDILIEGMPLPKPGSFPHPDVHIVSPGYIRTLGVRLLNGRDFAETDDERVPRVGMINAQVAQKFYADGNAVGKRFLLGRPTPNRPPRWITIVGVVADTKLYGLANPSRLEIYFPFRQIVRGDMSLLVKSRNDPAALTSAIRSAIAAVDKDQPVTGIATMNQVVNASISTPRITLMLLGLFSALALVLAAIGIYGVISYSVAQRTHEIGIRIALGAQRSEVLGMVLTDGAKIAGAGVLVGLIASFGLARLMTGLLFSVSAADPMTFTLVAILLALIAMLACYVPARRTLRVDPVNALRHE